MITARDYSDSTAFTSRHNMQNTMDLTLSGAGQMMVVTSSGGPEVTESPIARTTCCRRRATSR